MQKGKLLFQLASAEDKGQKKSLISLSLFLFVPLCITFYCIGAKYLFNSTYDAYNEDENTMFYILTFLFLFFIAFMIVWAFQAKKKGEEAKLYLFENCIEGTAETKSSGFNVTFENFCLSYNDIINISSMDRYVILYTQWQTYKVLAFNRHNEIIRIINAQKDKQSRKCDELNDKTDKKADMIDKCPYCDRKISVPEDAINAFCPWCNKKIF